MENASRRYDSEKVKQMIERQKAKYGWEFLFLGANIDAVETASQFGIGADLSLIHILFTHSEVFLSLLEGLVLRPLFFDFPRSTM